MGVIGKFGHLYSIYNQLFTNYFSNYPLDKGRVERHECTGDMLYKTDRRHGLHHGGEQLAFPALAWRMKMRLCLGKRLEPWINACSFYRAI